MEFRYWYRAEYLAGFADDPRVYPPPPVWKPCGGCFTLPRACTNMRLDPELLDKAYDWIVTPTASKRPLFRNIRIFDAANVLVWAEEMRS